VQVNSGNTIYLFDKKLMSDADPEQVKRDAILGGWFIQDDEDTSPSMTQSVQILEGTVDIPPLPLSLQTFALKPDNLVLFFWETKSSAHERNHSDNPSTTL
jgi:hypothetical protein